MKGFISDHVGKKNCEGTLKIAQVIAIYLCEKNVSKFRRKIQKKDSNLEYGLYAVMVGHFLEALVFKELKGRYPRKKILLFLLDIF